MFLNTGDFCLKHLEPSWILSSCQWCAHSVERIDMVPLVAFPLFFSLYSLITTLDVISRERGVWRRPHLGLVCKVVMWFGDYEEWDPELTLSWARFELPKGPETAGHCLIRCLSSHWPLNSPLAPSLLWPAFLLGSLLLWLLYVGAFHLRQPGLL